MAQYGEWYGQRFVALCEMTNDLWRTEAQMAGHTRTEPKMAGHTRTESQMAGHKHPETKREGEILTIRAQSRKWLAIRAQSRRWLGIRAQSRKWLAISSWPQMASHKWLATLLLRFATSARGQPWPTAANLSSSI